MRIMLVCGFGLGTSMILKLKLDELLAQQSITATTFCADITTAPGEQYDILFTSQDFANRFNSVTQPVIVINNFLDSAEIAEKGLGIIRQMSEQ